MRQVFKQPRLLFKLLSFLIFLLLIQIFLSFAFVHNTSINDVETSLKSLSARIEKDLRFVNGKWDTQLYNADPFTPYPNGSSGFMNPLYIVTNTGFIIERSQPINGFLDTSDFKHLIQFKTPNTIDTLTNEKWRILSKPIENNGKTLGVIVVSYYNPHEIDTREIDIKLSESISTIENSISIKNSTILISDLDIRNIHYEFSFEVVDQFNNVLINNGRVPTFIDASYFSKELSEKRVRSVFDRKTQEEYLTISTIINNNSGDPVGIVVAGESLKSIHKTLQNFILVSLLITGGLIFPLSLYSIFILRNEIVVFLSSYIEKKQLTIKKIFFDKKRSMLVIDDNQYVIPYASNQYYICHALFSHPTKKWEYDELLEKLGDSSEQINTRKVYDVTLAINKKVGIKLIDYKFKVFSLNTDFISFVTR